MKKSFKALFLFLLVLVIFFIVLVTRKKLIIFDVCEAKAAMIFSANKNPSEMSPPTEIELKYFPELRGSWPSAFSHEVYKCKINGEGIPFFKW